MNQTVFDRRERIKFTHFTRKGYSLFAALGKEVLIGTLSVATLTYAKADSISVSPERNDTLMTCDEKDVMLDEVDVTASRAPLTGGQTARIITVLSREDIAVAPVQSVNDLLKYAVGVDVRQRGPIGAQTDISIRGGTSEHIAILLNGINICDPQTGHNAFDLPADISDIERIEIIEGPAGRIHGTSSLVGAINVVTKKDRSGSIGVRMEGGSFGYAAGGARVALAKGRWSGSVSGGYTRGDGYMRSKSGRLNADYEGGKAFVQGRYDDTSLSVRWHAGMSVKSWGSNTFYSVKSDEQYEHTDKYFTAVQAETKGGRFHFRPSVYWNRFQDRYEFFRGQPDKSPFNYHRTDIYGVNLNSWLDWRLGRTAFGAEFRNEDLVSGNLGEPLDNKIHIHGTDRDYTNGLNRSNLSLFLEHNIKSGRLAVSAGFTAVKNTWNGMPFKIYPGIDASCNLGKGWRLFASFNMSLRMPSFTELYYSVDGHKADKYLKPEEMSAFEGGVKYSSEGVSGALSVYHRRGKNMIDWIMDVSDGEAGVWQSVNHTKINATGFEVSGKVDFATLLPNQHVVKSLDVAYGYISQDREKEENIESLYALEYLRHKLTASLRLNPLKDLYLNINYRYQYRIGSFADMDKNIHRYSPYSVMDAGLSWDKSRYSIYVYANNLLDTDYVDYGNVSQPGIWVVGGLKLNFEI